MHTILQLEVVKLIFVDRNTTTYMRDILFSCDIVAYMFKGNHRKSLLGNGCVTRKNAVTVVSNVSCAVHAETIYRGPAVITEVLKRRLKE